MRPTSPLFVLLVLSCLLVLVAGWTKEDHEIFRLRDEVEASEGEGVTFYDFLGVKPTASQDDIIKAFRKKSRLLHPDKVKASIVAARAKPTGKAKKGEKPKVHVAKAPKDSELKEALEAASDRYGRLTLVNTILRGSERERYDHFLKNGFPRWKGTGYYYSRFRPGLGSVLLGLFVFGGGAGHYAVLYLSWKRQREFVGRYVREARRAAWGNDMGISALAGIGTTTAVTPSPAQDEMGMQGMNRRQRRMEEKSKKKVKGGADSGNGSSNEAPAAKTVSAGGGKKRVVAENGKVLVVDSVGNVYLSEENEDGETEEYLLDIDEIPKPTMKQTIVFRLPIWLFKTATSPLRKKEEAVEEEESEGSSSDTDGPKTKAKLVARGPNGHSRARGKRGNRS